MSWCSRGLLPSLVLLLLGTSIQPGDSAIKNKLKEAGLNELIVTNKFDAFVDLLSKEETDPNQPESGRLPIVEAVKSRELKYVDTLIQYGAMANGRDPATKASAIQYAFQGSLVEIARLLLAYGADINAEDKSGAKARSFAPTQAIREMIAKYDKDGPMGFEDAPGTWIKAKTEKDEIYWFNHLDKSARWNTPPSCAWQVIEHQGHPIKYHNSVTGQEVFKRPAALSWAFVINEGKEMWYNWATNATQLEEPDELTVDLLKQAKENKNVRWFNAAKNEFSWEDPAYHTPWRKLQHEDGSDYYFNIETGDSKWEVPEELAWSKVESEDKPGDFFFHHTVSGETTWEPQGHHAWERHDSDL